jgi:hypothetical protein
LGFLVLVYVFSAALYILSFLVAPALALAQHSKVDLVGLAKGRLDTKGKKQLHRMAFWLVSGLVLAGVGGLDSRCGITLHSSLFA